MRLFLAVELPEAVRFRLRGVQDRLRSAWPGWRWIRPEGIHLTVRFLGEVLPELDSRARQGWRNAAAEIAPFSIGFGGLGRFPPRGRPRVMWVAVRQESQDEGLALVAERVEQAARELGFQKEARPFRAHLTLARAARGQEAAWFDGFDPGIEELVEVDRLVLFQSMLAPSGARYTALDSYPLRGLRKES